MFDGLQNKMNKLEMLFILTSLVSLTAAIRVDWNTNKGPIVPPTTTVRPVPKPPFRDPAPVWENQNDDQINPNPYQYVLPPPSRPKLLDDNYARAPISPIDAFRYKYEKQPNYGRVIMPLSPNDVGYNNNFNSVPTLAVYYVPNVGLKYDAVVPSSTKTYYLKENDIYDNKYNTKLNGKYNPKLKKYKAYEKMKYLPHLYYIRPEKLQKQQQQQLQQQQQQNYFNQPLPYVNDKNRQPFYSQQQQLLMNSQNNKDYYRSQKDEQKKLQWQSSKNALINNALPTSSKSQR